MDIDQKQGKKYAYRNTLILPFIFDSILNLSHANEIIFKKEEGLAEKSEIIMKKKEI